MRTGQRSLRARPPAPPPFPYLHFEPVEAMYGLPLIVYLHGSGQKGVSLELLAEQASLPSLLRGGLDIAAHVLCPVAPAGPGWPVDLVSAFIEAAIEVHQCDPRRIYLTGESMGGRGVFEVAYWHPQRFAALLTLCAFGIPNLAGRLKGMPIWMFHGAKDNVLPVERGREMSEALLREGAAARLTVLEDEGHAIGRTVYGDRKVWDWLLSQRQAGATGPLALAART